MKLGVLLLDAFELLLKLGDLLPAVFKLLVNLCDLLLSTFEFEFVLKLSVLLLKLLGTHTQDTQRCNLVCF